MLAAHLNLQPTYVTTHSTRTRTQERRTTTSPISPASNQRADLSTATPLHARCQVVICTRTIPYRTRSID